MLEAIAGEVVLSERALIDGTRLVGTTPIAVLLVENLGPHLDIEVPEGWMVHVPGWNTATVKRVLEQLADVAIVHFGDLDPEGVRIAFHLRKAYPGLHWLVPNIWREYVPDRAQTTQWPADLVLDDAPELIEELRAAGKWIEQETIVLDPRLIGALQACC